MSEERAHLWRMVPLEITGEMLRAGAVTCGSLQAAYDAWHRMLAASPSPSPVAGDVERVARAMVASLDIDWDELRTKERSHFFPETSYRVFWMRLAEAALSALSSSTIARQAREEMREEIAAYCDEFGPGPEFSAAIRSRPIEKETTMTRPLTFMQRKYLLRLNERAIIIGEPGWSSRFLPTLRALERRGLAERVEDEDGAFAWQITEAGEKEAGCG